MNSVLVVDSHKFTRTLIRNNFSELDLTSIEDEVGVIESIKTSRPNLVLLDYNLSDNFIGLDLLKMIKNYDASIVVVMVCGFMNSALTDLAIEKGADFCYYKDKNLTNYLKDIINTIKQL